MTVSEERPSKRSVVVAGHPTSLSLEPEFWDVLRQIVDERSTTLNMLITDIDARRGKRGLSSAVRVFVLNYLGEYRNRLGSKKP
ncbi:putative DNA-binding ribbon-helix-helix protein [Rhodoligotrophos appendicifer]|uniref:ribbon-helix-helix domain-containing protein n=1 Tax=Rhodoligotrophos appendicifer TaxID=987056 RepID=UPI001184B769|nr:ribbon-helix-helix domain-containing protein [Rhodoligotrophos appendicifer]